MSEPTSVYQIPRNDIPAAVALYEARGSLTGSELAVLLQLQDDPGELLELCTNWNITEG